MLGLMTTKSTLMNVKILDKATYRHRKTLESWQNSFIFSILLYLSKTANWQLKARVKINFTTRERFQKLIMNPGHASSIFNISLKYFQKIIKQLLNSVLAGHEELLRPRFVSSASALIIPHIRLDLIQ